MRKYCMPLALAMSLMTLPAAAIELPREASPGAEPAGAAKTFDWFAPRGVPEVQPAEPGLTRAMVRARPAPGTGSWICTLAGAGIQASCRAR